MNSQMDARATLKGSSQDCILLEWTLPGNDKPVLSLLASLWHWSYWADQHLASESSPGLGAVLYQWGSSRHALSRAAWRSKQGGGQELPTAAAREGWIPVLNLAVLFPGLLTPVRSCPMVSWLTEDHWMSGKEKQSW